ncbi:hypothetical protein E5161_12060 [Cohnella pontilimi]|uniref:Uncharacterized protein n=1 Tax=Cohnella pontilimi TaxID=2564100 RepID=A0A4U0FAV1_9BACL|nr:hypothetical protein [Cohnella pontilimi]TJY41926.1 hypothetical protein E5161_12060 [Cohnella pontilimi]
MYTRRNKFQSAIHVMLAVLLITCSMFVAGPIDTFAATKKETVPTSISLGKNASVKINNVELFPQDKGLYLMFSLTYSNTGTTSLSLDDYWAKVKTTKGQTFSIKVADKDKNIKSLPGKSSAVVTYFAAVADDVLLSQLQINIVKWDFSAPNFTRSLGTFNLAKGYSAPVPAFQPLNITNKETKLKTAIKSVQMGSDGENRVVNISFLFENLNTRDYKAATTQLNIKTADGSIFEATNSSLKDLVVKPKQRKVITLKSVIPSDINLNGMKLLLGYQSDADGLFIPIASYAVPKASDGTIDDRVSQLTYGSYQIELTGYNRLPAGAQDALTANFTVTNKSTSDQKVPVLKSSWSINGVSQESNTPAVTTFDSRIQLAPGESIQIAARIMVPYNLNLKDIRVTLKETVDAQNENIIGQFKNTRVNQFTLSPDNKTSFSRLGSKTQVELLNIVSTGDSKQVSVNGSLAVTNIEFRPIKLQKYGVYLKSTDGQIFPLTVADYDKPIIANGKIIVPFSGKVPAAVKNQNMNLLLTELLPYTGDTNNKDLTVATNVISMTKAWPDSKPSSKFNNLSFGKYDMTISQVYLSLNMMDFVSAQGLKLEFSYNMVADPNVDDLAGTYKLRFEVEDQGESKAFYSKEYTLNGDAKTDDIIEGNGVRKTIEFSDPAVLERIKSFTSYKLSVYYVVNDEKVLLAQRVIPYFYVQWMQL